MGSISRMITEFCLDLYNKVNRTTECQNIVFSPLSISTSLGLILLGARNNTATQIENVSTAEMFWDASTQLAVSPVATLGFAAQHLHLGNKDKHKLSCCLENSVWCAVISLLLYHLSHPNDTKCLTYRAHRAWGYREGMHKSVPLVTTPFTPCSVSCMFWDLYCFSYLFLRAISNQYS